MAKHWMIYVNQRFPQIIWGPLAFGITLSASRINDAPINLPLFVLAFIPIWLFLFLIVLIKDFKNLEKDRLANPDYPLSRKIFTPKEVHRAILCLHIFLFAYSELLWVFMQSEIALLLFLLTVYSWLLSQNFFAPAFLNRRPFVKVFFEELQAIPLALFAVSMNQVHRPFSDQSWAFAILLFSAFYVYEICSKLNPKLHPAAGTPIQFYGFKTTFTAAAAFLFLGGIAAFFAGKGLLLWPAQLIVLGTLFMTLQRPMTYRTADAAATGSLVLHAWSGLF